MNTRKTEQRTLHFDLSHSPPGVTHTLHLGGRRYTLTAHTAQSRMNHRERNRLLRQVPDARLTHYLEKLPVLSGAIQSYYVTHPPKVGSRPNLAMLGIMVPKDVAKLAHQKHGFSRGLYNAKARRLGLLKRVQKPAQATGAAAPMALATQDDETGPAWLNDGDLADFVDMTEAATSIVYHHPGLITLSSNAQSSEGSLTAVQILGLIQATPQFQITDPKTGELTGGLVYALQQQGPAQNLDGWNQGFEGWANAVAWTDASGNPVVDDKGNPRWWYQYTQQTSDAMTPVVQQSLLGVQNQANLDGIAFKTNFGDHAQTDTPQAQMLAKRSALRTQKAVALAATAKAAADGDSGSGLQVTLTDNDWNFGRRVQVSSINDRDITFTVENSYFRHMGIFVRFVDGQNPPQPLALSSLTPAIASSVNDTEFDHFISFLGPRNRILGIPTEDETSTDLTVTLPDQASGMQILVGTMGHGALPSSPDTFQSVHVPGATLTGVLDLGLPAFFLLLGMTADVLELPEGKKLLLSLASWIVETFAQEIAIQAFPSGDVSKNELQTEWADNILQSIVKEAPEVFTALIKWALEVSAAEEALEWVPIVGQIIQALNVAGTLAEIAETAADALLSPWVIPDTLQTQMNVDVTVNKPTNDFQFPASATQIKIIATPSNSIPQIFSGALAELFPGYPQVSSLNTTFTLPSGGNVKIDVTLTADNGWVAASGSIGPVDNLLPQGASSLPLAVPITENPLPLSSNTQYVHKQKLGVDDSGAHQWITTSTPPQATASALGGNTALQLNELDGVTINMNGRLGYVWRATSPTLVDQNGSGGSQPLFTLQNINLDSSFKPDNALRILGSADGKQQLGYVPRIFMAYDLLGPTDGVNFIVAPAQDPTTGNVEYHAFQVTLDGTNPIDLSSAKSWGRFASATLDAVAVHPRGVIVALNAADEKVELLTLPDQPYDSLSDAEYAANQVGGLGQYIGRLHGSTAIAMTKDGNTFLVLEAVNNRIQAFSINGTSVQYFGGQPWIALTQPMDEGKQISWLGMSLESTGFLYVLSSEGDGSDPSQYRLDIYEPSGAWLSRTTGVPAGKLAVDAMRTVWTLNYEMIQGPSQRPEPSVSMWAGSNS